MFNLLKLSLIGLVVIILGVGTGTWWLIRPVSKGPAQIFTIPQNQPGFNTAEELQKAGLIRHPTLVKWLLAVVLSNKEPLAGGYRLSPNMNSWQIIQKVKSFPDLVWVTIPEGMRKEQIGERLLTKLGWSQSQLDQWNHLFETNNPEYREGVYFPDTYLLPRDEPVDQIAQRFINRFNDKMTDLFTQFQSKNILWTTGLKIASLIQREAGGPADMPLIAGIIWNRLDKGMPLQIDATLQYVQGRTDAGWWGPVDIALKSSDSPYNDYLTKGLPPTPICNPGLDAINAVVNPVDTKCLFYLHSADRQIHCAVTYQEHLDNIKKYLD